MRLSPNLEDGFWITQAVQIIPLGCVIYPELIPKVMIPMHQAVIVGKDAYCPLNPSCSQTSILDKGT